MTNLTLKHTDAAVERKVMNALLPQLNSFIKVEVIPFLKNEIGKYVSSVVGESPEIQSIMSGQLRTELGFAQPDSFVNAILEGISKSVHIKFDPFKYSGGTIAGVLEIGAVLADFSDLLALPKASYKSREFDVPWLRWLLFDGGNILIHDYQIEYGNFPRSRSRSGFAIMRRGAGYALPPGFTGIVNDNFITRALDQERVSNNIATFVKTALGV